MPTICDRCGKPSYVTYVKANPGSICDVCEGRERLIKGKPDEWKTIQAYNDKHHYHPHKLKPRGNILYLQSYRNVTEKHVRRHRILKTRVDET